ncbi:hypothetical protein C7S16_4067 [Burkholderia thailandensis]|uniref:Uncharacterized protein n=1 Tax=Burkholderia thailandensis TaxID=57975 RepID=A0AAW9D4M5_BURTH|nr:hypothetical protein [Burkholderia thailandensis]MDW9256930.1 hypothetical protein [Burkholderia thailandensis]
MRAPSFASRPSTSSRTERGTHTCRRARNRRQASVGARLAIRSRRESTRLTGGRARA